MLKINKNLVIIITVLLFISFIFGFFSHRYKIFPYHVFKGIKDTIWQNSPNSKEHVVLRKKYKTWNDINENFIPIKENFLKKYHPGINIFSDRHYFNHLGDNKLKNFSIIQLLKHQTTNIKLITSDEIVVYRAICKHNNNDKYKDWEKVDFKILIISHSCLFESLVKKKFKKGKILLRSGGPKSSDPIFILTNKKDLEIVILDNPIKFFLVPAYKLVNKS